MCAPASITQSSIKKTSRGARISSTFTTAFDTLSFNAMWPAPLPKAQLRLLLERRFDDGLVLWRRADGQISGLCIGIRMLSLPQRAENGSFLGQLVGRGCVCACMCVCVCDVMASTLAVVAVDRRKLQAYELTAQSQSRNAHWFHIGTYSTGALFSNHTSLGLFEHVTSDCEDSAPKLFDCLT